MDPKKPNVIPFDALFGETVAEPNLSNDPRPALQAADVIFGHDWTTGNEFLVFGRSALQRIAASGVAGRLTTMRIGLDQDTDELEKLLALVRVIKGKHEYQSGKGS